MNKKRIALVAAVIAVIVVVGVLITMIGADLMNKFMEMHGGRSFMDMHRGR